MTVVPVGPRECFAHKHKSYVDLDAHHIHPQEFHGPTVPDNLVWLCPNGHRRVHDYLRALMKNGKRPLTWRLYGAKVRLIAAEGYAAIRAAGLL